ATRNCPWNRCTFCYGSSYGRKKFQLRSVDDVKKDIDAINSIASLINKASEETGNTGVINQEVASYLLKGNPGLNNHSGFVHVFNWLYSGGKTAFIQDADSLIMPTKDLVEILEYLKQAFPSIERITSYARSHTVARKSPGDLSALRQAGLTRLHMGLETGDDELLVRIEKGVTAAQQVAAGLKAREAGFEISEYVMPDIGGRSRSDQHAKNTAMVLNKINPDFIRFRPFIPRANTPVYDEYLRGELKLSSPHERLLEIKNLVEKLEVNSRLVFDHFLNPSFRSDGRIVPLFKQDYDGYKLPEEKDKILQLISRGLEIDNEKFLNAEDLVGMPSL
ncbi:MAG: radical SAM protein, partial [Dehalococcoidia bacterium]|nr:radical SAM protein [Dehalococcoidia bacterium]